MNRMLVKSDVRRLEMNVYSLSKTASSRSIDIRAYVKEQEKNEEDVQDCFKSKEVL